ncbi:MAG: lipooligosaccharide transport system permease protein [Chloroflexota bacterium]|jgi:lipooligosaccharide transport system permease protein|nr:lipooligosaccharide transport system permease protein [Chloroflexota bacterium]
MTAAALTRQTQPSPWATAARVFEHRARQYRRLYRASLFSSFGIPALFLTAMGAGLGGYVDKTPDAVLAGVGYLQFLAPGLLASSLMQTGAFEAAFPILGGLQWNRIFHAMAATPLDGRDVALGNIAWIAVRLTLVGTIFAMVIVLFGATRSWLIVLAVPVAVLTGLAFAVPIMAFTATQRTPEKFSQIFRFGVTPLFLFSGTFFPIESLPSLLQPVAWLSPLWHGVAVARALMLGTIGDAPLLALLHVAILLAIVIGGTVASIRTIRARLEKG